MSRFPFSRRSALKLGASAALLPQVLPRELFRADVRARPALRHLHGRIPLTTGQPDRGAGAYQFTGYTLYDPLVAGR